MWRVQWKSGGVWRDGPVFRSFIEAHSHAVQLRFFYLHLVVRVSVCWSVQNAEGRWSED